MFLFARLVIDNLAHQLSREHFFDETVDGRFPENLNTAYYAQETMLLSFQPIPYQLTAMQVFENNGATRARLK